MSEEGSSSTTDSDGRAFIPITAGSSQSIVKVSQEELFNMRDKPLKTVENSIAFVMSPFVRKLYEAVAVIDRRQPVPATKWNISVLPIGIFHQDECPVKECHICSEIFEEEDKLRILPCGHLFHRACTDRWLGVSRLCPLCKGNVVELYKQWRTQHASDSKASE